jgi:hypothetical protein
MTPMPRDDHDAADAAVISRQKMLTRATIGLGSAMGPQRFLLAQVGAGVLSRFWLEPPAISRASRAGIRLVRTYAWLGPRRSLAGRRRSL